MTDASFPVASRQEVIQELRTIWQHHRIRFALVVTLFGAGSLLGLASPRLVGILIDRLNEGTTMQEVALYCLGMFTCTFAQFFSVFFGTREALVLGEDVFAKLRNDFMKGALGLPIGDLERGGTGELLTRTTQDIAAVSATIRRALPESLIAIVTVIFTVVAATLTSPLIAPVYLLSAPILYFAMRWYLKRAGDVYEQMSSTYGPVFASISETASGARTVEALALADARADSIDLSLARRWVAARARIRLRQIMLPWSNLAFAVPVFACLAWGGWLVLHNSASIGTVVSMTLFAAALTAPLEALIRWTDELQKGFVSFARILGVSRIQGESVSVSQLPKSDLIEAKNVRFSYSPDREVLRGVSLRLIPGERMAIVGASGAGKSTLARLLAGLDDPDSGKVLIGGVEATSIQALRRRREVLLVSQESHVFATSIRENLNLARVTASDEEISAALSRIGALTWVRALEDGIDTVVGANGLQLTGAQEQELALARVILADPHTLILDEATSAMDPKAARRLERALAATLKGRTVVAIAHRLYTAFDADRIAVMDRGKIIEMGSHDELIKKAGAYSRLWNAWSDDKSASNE